MPAFQKPRSCLSFDGNSLASNFTIITSTKCYSHLLWLTVLLCPPLPPPTIFHHLNMVFEVTSHSFTHPPLTSPSHPIPTPSPPYLLPLSLLSNYIQHYTGGSWVRRQTRSSGEWCKSWSGPLPIWSFSWSSSSCSTPHCSLPDNCLSCLLAFSLPISVLSLFFK